MLGMELPRKVSLSSHHTSSNYVCNHCKMSFVREDKYLAHKCKQMKRAEEFQSPDGQAAWNYYQQWMKRQRKAVHQPTSFLNSRYFRTFLNFASFVKRVDLPMVDKFIWLMIEKKYPPTLWTSDEIYTIFLEFLDFKTTPMEQFAVSLQTVMKYADKLDIDITRVFDTIAPNEVIHLIRKRRLSPWFLLFSKSFKKMFKMRMSQEEMIIMENLIRPEFWVEQFENHPREVEKIKSSLQEIDL